MDTLIIYDSKYGNTTKIAKVIATALSARATAVTDITTVPPGTNLLIIGSPTQGGKPTSAIQAFLSTLQSGTLSGTAVAAFDTRFNEKTQNFFLRTLMKTIGYAAPKILNKLTAAGGRQLVEPKGFIVADTAGPLIDTEIAEAEDWVEIIKQASYT